MLQIQRNLVDEHGSVLAGKKYLIIDRDTKFSQPFREFLEEGGTKVIRLPPLSPNLNAYAERFVRSIKEERLGRMRFIGAGVLASGDRRVHGAFPTKSETRGSDVD